MFKMFTKIKNLLKTKKPIILSLLLFFIVLALFSPIKLAHANILELAGGALKGIFSGLTGAVEALVGVVIAFFVVVNLGGVLLSIAVVFLTWVTGPNFIGLSYTNNWIIEIGWGLTRNLANIGFVIVLIIIGLATALRIREYQWQKTLPRLIVIILLINFTPVIAGVVVDGANILMNEFLKDTLNFKVLTTANTPSLSIGTIVNEVMNFNIFGLLGRIIVNIAYYYIAAAILFVFSILLVLRHVAIWILVILSPLAFFAYILPKTKHYFSAWWKQFIQWSFIGAISGFFLYLSLKMLNQVDDFNIGNTPDGLFGLGDILSYLVIIVFLYIAFFVTLKSSAMGANTIIGWAKRREKGFVRWTGRKAQVGAQVAIKSERFKKIADRIATAPTVFGKLIRPLGRAMQRLPGEQDKIFDKAESDAKNMDAARVATQVTKGTIPFLREPGRVAGLLSGAAEDLDKAKDIIEKYNISTKEIVNAIKWTLGQGRIDRAKKMFRGYGETLTDKGIRPEDMGLKFDLTKEKDREEAAEYGITREDAKKAGFSVEMAEAYEKLYKENRGYLGKMLTEARTVDEIKSFKKILKSDDEWVQNVVHKFWDGTQLHRAGEEIGAAFIEKFQDNAKDEFYYIKENPKMHKYLSSTAAQSAGYSFGSSETADIKNWTKGNLQQRIVTARLEVNKTKGKLRQEWINRLSIYERELAKKETKEWKEKEEAEIGAPKEAEAKKAGAKKPKGVITKEMKARLRGLGYTDDEIKKMTPEETQKKTGGRP